MDEEALIAAAKSGEAQAFNRLVLAYQSMVYNTAYRILGDSDAAQDATQECFTSAFKGIERFRGGSFRAWLLRIVTNACYDHLRRKKRRPATPLDDLVEDPERASFLVNHQEEPDERAMRLELAGVIQAGIATLPPDQRITLVLSDVQGLSYREIAQVTGVSLGTVKSRLSRGRARLRDYLLERKELLPTSYRLRDRERHSG